MAEIDQAIDFLIRHDSLKLGSSPWGTYGAEEDVYQVAWERLFPAFSVEEDLWELGDIASMIADLEGTLRYGSAQRVGGEGIESPSAGCGANWDVCAWYQPIHFFGYDWGIFIREDCVRNLIFRMARFARPPASQPSALVARSLLRAAVYAYFLHEHYHHKVECLGFRLHVATGTSAYLPYQTGVYQNTSGTDDQLEEALANADAFHRLRVQPYLKWISPQFVQATKDYLRWSFPADPPGYRMARNYLTGPAFENGENLLHGQVREASLKPIQPAADWDLAPRLMQSFFPVTANIWAVVPAGTRPILPHVAPAPTCSTRALAGLLRGAGYKDVPGGKGSHVKFAKDGQPTIVLPGDRRDLSPGVVKTALKVLGNYRLADLQPLLRGAMELPSV